MSRAKGTKHVRFCLWDYVTCKVVVVLVSYILQRALAINNDTVCYQSFCCKIEFAVLKELDKTRQKHQ